jgi:chromosome partitioning protein
LNLKGGVGRTTLAVNLAACFHRAGARVLLVDSDPQGSATAWFAARQIPPLFEMIALAEPRLHKDIPARKAEFDIIVIDGAARRDDLARAALLASDVTLIPIQPSPFDLWAAQPMVTLVREGRGFNRDLRAAFLVNRRIGNTAIGRDFVESLGGYGEFPVLSTPVMQRIAYVETAAVGLSVIEGAPRSEASREIGLLAEQVLLFARAAAPVRELAA